MKVIINRCTNKPLSGLNEAAKYHASIDEQHLIDQCVNTTLHVHHTAKARGYIKKGQGYIEQYEGRFGKGYIYHNANCENTFRYSNNYHNITYYIY